MLNNSGQIFCDQTIPLSKPSLSHDSNTGGDHVRGSKGFHQTIFKRCPEEEYFIIFLSIIYYRPGVPLDNGKEPGGAAGGDGEGWKAILRKRRRKIETRVEGNIEEKNIYGDSDGR